MWNWIDGFLNKITMYRLVLYYLIALWVIAFLFSVIGFLHFEPLALILSALIIIASSWITNVAMGKLLKAPTNVESVYITAFILALIITPASVAAFTSSIPFLVLASVGAMASKFVFAIKKKHVFNPAAFGVALTAFTISQAADWWVGGNLILLPFVILGGVLIARKIHRWDLVFAFFGGAVASIALTSALNGFSPLSGVEKSLTHAPLFFFAFVMITEPLTTPPTRSLRIAYGALVGLLFAPSLHVGSVYSTPELALLVGNIFSYLVSPKGKFLLRLKEKIQLTPDTYDFVFAPAGRMTYRPGQYMEWTIGQANADDRGNRRYFTLASSPTEAEPRIGVKFYPKSSTFKKQLLSMKSNDTVSAGQLAGDFTLPLDPSKKLVFIAGGIGVTPFRSMVKYLLDTNEARDITLFYSNKTAADVAYKELFDEAQRVGVKTIYTLSDAKELPSGWTGKAGMITKELICDTCPDFKDRIFYISGPQGMVNPFQKTLADIGVPLTHIKLDFFPGFA